METLLVGRTATHFHVFNKYRCHSLVLQTLVQLNVAWQFDNP